MKQHTPRPKQAGSGRSEPYLPDFCPDGQRHNFVPFPQPYQPQNYTYQGLMTTTNQVRIYCTGCGQVRHLGGA